MRFHLIDRVDLVEPHKSIVARKLTSRRETYWRDEGGALQMPSSLVFEALCQAGTWLVMSSSDFDRRAALMSVDSLTFGVQIHPGDVLRIEGTVESFGLETAVLSGRVTVGGTTALTAEGIMCVLMPASELEDVEAARRMHRQLIRPVPAVAK